LSEISAAIKMSIAEEIKFAAFEEYKKAKTTLKNMYRGAGRLFESVYKLIAFHTLFVYQI